MLELLCNDYIKERKKFMKVIVVGCGKIGTTIISNLVDEGHNVVAVDVDHSVVDNITNIYDAIGEYGSGTEGDVLTKAGVKDAELIIATTPSDELNMLCCYIARKMGASHTIARIRRPEHNINNIRFLCHHLGISMILNPEMLAAREIFNILKLPYAVKIETFSQKNFEIVEIILKENCALTGIRLMDIRNKLKQSFLVCAVQRKDEVFIPGGDFVLQKGDKIGLTASPTEMQKLMRALKLDRKQAKNVMIIGGSNIAYYLAEELILSGTKVKLIEKDKKRSDELAINLSEKARVAQGDGTQQEVLMEEGLGTADAFVSLTGMDEQNILISIFAAMNKVPKTIAKINRSELSSMAKKLGLDCVISPRKIASDTVVRYARALENSRGSNVETLYKIMDDKVEVLEFKASNDFEGLGIQLKDLKLKKNVLIGGIMRDKKPIIPSGLDKFENGDRVIVVASGIRLNDLSDILQEGALK